MPQINYVTITNDFIKDGFFSEYLPPVFSIHNSFDPCSISLSSTADLVAPLSFNMSRFTEDGKRRTIYMPVFEAILSIAFHSPSVTQKDFFLFRLRPCLVNHYHLCFFVKVGSGFRPKKIMRLCSKFSTAMPLKTGVQTLCLPR